MTKSLVFGLAIAIAVGLMVAISVTWMDWRFNPGGIFHGAEGTNWEIVGDTAWSWFWPVTLAAVPVAVIGCAWVFRRRN